jgi:hypothetical protein
MNPLVVHLRYMAALLAGALHVDLLEAQRITHLPGTTSVWITGNKICFAIDIIARR